MPYRSGGEVAYIRGVSPSCDRALIQGGGALPALGEVGAVHDVFYWSHPGTLERDTIAAVAMIELWGRELFGSARPSVLPWGTGRESVGMSSSLIALANGRTLEVRLHDLEGSLVRVIRWDADPRPVETSDRRRYDRARRVWLSRMPAHPETDFLLPELDAYPRLAAAKPVLDRVLLSSEGDLWVRQFPAESFGPFDTRLSERRPGPQVWHVFDGSGRWVADVTVPGHLEIRRLARGRAYGIARDEYDAETAFIATVAF